MADVTWTHDGQRAEIVTFFNVTNDTGLPGDVLVTPKWRKTPFYAEHGHVMLPFRNGAFAGYQSDGPTQITVRVSGPMARSDGTAGQRSTYETFYGYWDVESQSVHLRDAPVWLVQIVTEITFGVIKRAIV